MNANQKTFYLHEICTTQKWSISQCGVAVVPVLLLIEIIMEYFMS